ncbi:hypothetical protein [Carboxylicivirga sp. N1Y90]|uniref:hypothetical protein n=1 Tax=Carboxylicivirga fragile TaxID=3417571 RepID=UPI003D342F74|nr:hypothetical protein [Marinilabiliaceae bacterium N1Y90]
MELNNKRILIISPEPWGKMLLSKHHYTLELLKKGNTVYFLSGQSNNHKWKISKADFTNKLFFISYPRLPLLEKIRFHYRSLYLFILSVIIPQLNRKIGKTDLLISFDCNGVFPKLKMFEASKRLFFPVDQIPHKYRSEYSGFEHVLSITPIILNSIQTNKEKHLFHHGLNSAFAQNALNLLKSNQAASDKKEAIKVAYVGNLLIGEILDRKSLTTIIEEHPQIEFHFFGPYSAKQSNIGASANDESVSFITYLKKQSNCTLHGAMSPDNLVTQLNDFHAYLLCYNNLFDKNEGSNAHKIMEYLSYGKAIIASNVSMFNKNSHLLHMLPDWNNDNYPGLFNKIIKELKQHNEVAKQKERINFALSNQYKDKIIQIENIISL